MDHHQRQSIIITPTMRTQLQAAYSISKSFANMNKPDIYLS